MIEKLLDHFIVAGNTVLSFAERDGCERSRRGVERSFVEDTEGLTFCDRRENHLGESGPFGVVAGADLTRSTAGFGLTSVCPMNAPVSS